MFLDKLKYIRAFVLDIDGVLTDGTVHVTETGEQLRKFHVRDGYAMQRALKSGLLICIISGGRSQSVVHRFSGLGITEVHLGIESKAEVFQDFLKQHQLDAGQVAYIGDDIPDIPVMKLAGLPVCPADAVPEVKACSLYISRYKGGEGCVRDLIERVLKIQEKWYNASPSASEDTITSS